MVPPAPAPSRVDRQPPPEDLRRLLADVGPVAPAWLATELQRHTGRPPPPMSWLLAALRADPWLAALPDGRWVDLRQAVDGRCVTSAPDPTAWRTGVLPVGTDLAVAVRPFSTWQRIPVSGAGRRGLAEQDRTPTGDPVLVMPPGILPPPAPLLLAVAGPEGLTVRADRVDEVADARLRRTLVRLLRTQPPASGWSAVDLHLAALATDPTVARQPTRPLSHLLETALAPAIGQGRR